MDQQTLCKKLKSLRIETFGEAITDSEFGRRTGVSKGSIGPIMQERQWVRYDTLEKWVVGCGTTLQEFFMQEKKDPARPYILFDHKHREYYRLLNHILQHGSPKQVVSLKNQLEALSESIPSSQKAKSRE